MEKPEQCNCKPNITTHTKKVHGKENMPQIQGNLLLFFISFFLVSTKRWKLNREAIKRLNFIKLCWEALYGF